MARFLEMLLIFTTLIAPPAAANDWGHLYAEIGIASDYRFDGMSSSNRQPAWQGGLHWALPENFYAGLFTTRVRFRDERHTSYELDWYGGRHFIFDGNDVNLQALYSTFPNQAAHAPYAGPDFIFPTYNFFEASAEWSHRFGAFTPAGKLLWSPAYGSNTGTLWSMGGKGTYVFTSWLKADAGVSHRWVERGTNRISWDAGATLTWKQVLSLDLRYYGTSSGRIECYGMDWCGPGFAAKVGLIFPIF